MKQNKSIWTSIAGYITSIFAFLGIVSCCGMPIVAGLLSLLGIGASQLSFFEEYKWWFIAISIVCLVWGFIQLYGKKKSCCCSCGSDNQDDGKKSSKQALAKLFLWIGTVLTAYVIIYNLSSDKASSSCCPAKFEHSVQPGCCGSADDEAEIEFENHSSAPSCCGESKIEESKNSANDCDNNCSAYPSPCSSRM